MTTLIVPPLEEEPYPTLGPGVCDWIEDNLVFGPGDLRGQPARLDDEKRALIYRAYEIYPDDHPNAGRRRFRRVALSLQKGSAKTELAAWIAAAELHPRAPVRFAHWSNGTPVGRGLPDVYVPMCAYTEEQTEDLAYGALRVILEMSRVAKDFDIGLARIMRRDDSGKAEPLASAPDARDGARTTFQHKDETHRWTLPRLKAAARSMTANLVKRKLAEPWELETTTAYSTGEGSVAEDTMEYARSVEEGKRADTRLFFFHRQATELGHDLATKDGLRAAAIEAAGPTAAWKDIDGIVEQFDDPTADREYLYRVWLNIPGTGSGKAFPAEQWAALADGPLVTLGATGIGLVSRRGWQPPEGELVTLGFDGSRFRDATAIVGTHVATGHQWIVGLWEPPLTGEGAKATSPSDWEVDRDAVDSTMVEAFERWRVWRLYADPPLWGSEIAAWAGRFGEKSVVEWWTNHYKKMAYALQGYRTAIVAGDLSHDGDVRLSRHIANACRQPTNVTDDDSGEKMWIARKDRKDSPFKIDAAVAGCLSWQARQDAIASGALEAGPPKGISVYVPGEDGA